MSSYYTIKVKKYQDIVEEFDAGGTITPGMLIALGSAGTVAAHATQQGDVTPKMFALEDELQGNDIDDNYTSGDKVQCWVAQSGEQVQAILADGESVSIGDKLASNGAGYLQKHVAETESWDVSVGGSVTVYPEAIVAIAMEALNLSGSSGEESSGLQGNHRIRAMVI